MVPRPTLADDSFHRLRGPDSTEGQPIDVGHVRSTSRGIGESRVGERGVHLDQRSQTPRVAQASPETHVGQIDEPETEHAVAVVDADVARLEIAMVDAPCVEFGDPLRTDGAALR